MALTHVDESGRPRMVDVGQKEDSERVAVASGRIRMSRAAFDLVAQHAVQKGNVIGIAEIAGTMAAKRTAELIPLCHPLMLDAIRVEATPDETLPGVQITATVSVTGKTGVEMEALTAVSVACLTVYDMVKAIDRNMTIEGIQLDEKRGGKSGTWTASRDTGDAA